MITIKYLTKSAKSLICLTFIYSQIQIANCQDKVAVDELTKLSQQAKTNFRGVPSETIVEVVGRFNMLINKISFELSLELPSDTKNSAPDSTDVIIMTTDIAVAILRSVATEQLNLKTSTSPTLVAIDIYWEKLNHAIDPGWKMLRVTSNVSPPLGTPNAAAGMNPDAIADPILKQKYLYLIKKNQVNNLKNGQQRALLKSRDIFMKAISDLVSKTPGQGWSQIDVEMRFCKDVESKAILEKNLKLR